MAKGDRPSVDVHLFDVQPKLTHAVDVHRSEGFVDLSSRVVESAPWMIYWGTLPQIGPRPPWRFLPGRVLLEWRQRVQYP